MTYKLIDPDFQQALLEFDVNEQNGRVFIRGYYKSSGYYSLRDIMTDLESAREIWHKEVLSGMSTEKPLDTS